MWAICKYISDLILKLYVCLCFCGIYFSLRRVWRYQRGNHNPYNDEEHTTQNKENKKYKQRSTKHIHKTKDRVKQTSQKTGGELRSSGRESSSFSTSGTRRVNLVTNRVIICERGKDRGVFTTRKTHQSVNFVQSSKFNTNIVILCWGKLMIQILEKQCFKKSLKIAQR